jgi:predicted transcriptional regulator of viral defense system
MEVRSLSRSEAKVVLSLEAEGREVVSLEEIRRATRATPGFARKIAFGLVRKGWLQRTRRGVYLLNPSRHGPEALPDTDPLRVGSLLAEPYYFGYATAAELHGLLPQAGHVYYIVTPSRQGSRRFGPSRFQAVRVRPSRFFGTETLRRRGREIVVSDRERTVLDCLARPLLAGGMGGAAHVFALAKPRLDWRRLGAYLARLGVGSLQRRVGFLSEHVRPSVRAPSAWVRRFLPGPRAPYTLLAPPGPYGRRGVHDPRWRVIRNVPDPELFAEGRIP